MITEEYPLARMQLLVNGEPVEFALKHLGERWRILLSEAMPLRRGRNDIVLEVPEFLRISDVVPGAKDSRKMAIALTEICLVTQED
jgi:hypothetical protein